MAINPEPGNTPQERQAIDQYFERCVQRRERPTFEVILDFDDDQSRL